MSGGAPPLAELVSLLEGAGIAYMVVGSFASTYHGPPRTTHDIDVVVELSEASLAQLLEAIDRDHFYIADDASRRALINADQFNIVDLRSGWKIDLIVRKHRAFSREEFERRQVAEIEGVNVCIASAEDTVLAKLERAASGGSDRQVTDAAAVLAVGRGELDDEYMERWARDLGIGDLLARARRLADR